MFNLPVILGVIVGMGALRLIRSGLLIWVLAWMAAVWVLAWLIWVIAEAN